MQKETSGSSTDLVRTYPHRYSQTDEYDDETAKQLNEVCFDLSAYDNRSTQGCDTTKTTVNGPRGSADPIETPGSSSGHVGTEVHQSDVTEMTWM